MLTFRASLLAAGPALVVAVMPATAQAQGLLELLFGVRPQPQYQPMFEREALPVTVNPRKKKVEVAAPAPPKLQTPIDPAKNPNWYLTDPTLRRGDIVVLKGQVLVYDGGRGARDDSDFTLLSRSKLISKEERQRVQKMAASQPGGSAEPAASAAPLATSTRAVDRPKLASTQQAATE